MVYNTTIFPGSLERMVSPGPGDLENFKHILGYWRGTNELKSKRDLAGEVLRVAIRRSCRPRSPAPGGWKVTVDGWGDQDPRARSPPLIRGKQSPKLMSHSPRVLRCQSPVLKEVVGSKISSPRLRVRSPKVTIKSPQLRKATGRDSPKLALGTLKSRLGKESPRLTGRVHKPAWRPKKSVHWKTNIATWIQMTAKNSSVSVCEASSCGDDWSCRHEGHENETSDDDGTMRFNTAGKSIYGGSSTKDEDSSDFEYTDFAQVNKPGERRTNTYVNPYFISVASGPPPLSLRKQLHPPPPPPPPDGDLGSNYYNELNCSCGCQGSVGSSHTYEDVEDSFDTNSLTSHDTKQQRNSSSSSSSRSSRSSSNSSNHTYCEISQVGRGAKREVLSSLLRNDHHLESLKSTLVHVLPKDDITSTTLLACRLGDLEYLQDLAKQSRLNPCARDLQGATCVHYAARGGHLHILRFLLEDQGQRQVMKCDVGATPLHDAAALGHLDTLKYLRKHSKHTLDLTDKDGATVLHVAAR
ncbi:uncharacterized protein LOC121875934 [Homarus americanus]|uniref:uncharacterized protein LOC121875934 n=1 Tax=Homarus americanus TaxID=6706 RepID=UPI001C48D60E|nr:uncharacterized protein LOC121875934 [Homarus americanus]